MVKMDTNDNSSTPNSSQQYCLRWHNHQNITKTSPKRDTSTPMTKEPETPSPTPTPTPTPTSTPTPTKLISPLENLFAKTFQFCPSLMTNPLNFSQSAISRGAEIFARYQNQCRMNQLEKCNENLEENGNRKSIGENKKTKSSDMKKIDQIAEHLRSGSTNRNCLDSNKVASAGMAHSPTSAMLLISSPFSSLAHFMAEDNNIQKMPDFDHTEPTAQYHTNDGLISELDKTITSALPPKASNSKLYATCFICYKQLSNQYNLRVHLETHQNVRYACSVCSHVSRSKDALRKHISYRHPGAPSPCESESKRKRMKVTPQVSQMPQTSVVKQESNAFASTSQMHLSQNMTLQQQLSSQSYCEPTNYHMSSISKPSDTQLPTNLHATDTGQCSSNN